MPDLFPPDFGIFTRNYRQYIEEAVAKKEIVFRSSEPWKTAHDALKKNKICVLYLAVVGEGTMVQYKAGLEEVWLNPIRGQPDTERLLALTHSGLEDDELLKLENKPVSTLYRLTDCEKITPFSMTELILIVGGKPISPNYGYAYALVKPRNEDAPD